MAVLFIVEDGTGIVDANAYISVAFFKQYHKDRGTTLTIGQTEIETVIIRATDYIVARWQFQGLRQLNTQGLHWPAFNAFYFDGRPALLVPIEVKQSCADYGLVVVNGGVLAPNPTYDDSNAVVSARREKVGPIEEEFSFGGGGSPRSFRKFPGPDQRLIRSGLVINGREILRN